MRQEQIRLPWYFKWIKVFFKITEILFPPLANYWAYKFFTTPLQYPYPEKEKPYYHQAKKQHFTYQGKSIMCYEWGSEEKPTILLMHGWSARATQFRTIIDALLTNYHLVAIDAPAHGKSEGKETDLFGFAGAMKKIVHNYPNLYAIIGHSLGGVAAILNVKNGLPVEKLVVMASPAVASDILDNFIQRINAFPQRARYLKRAMKKKYNLDFEQATASEVVKNFPEVPCLLVYDEQDEEAPIRHGEILKAQMKHAQLLTTRGLGHTRILHNQHVIQSIIKFLDNDESP